MTVQQEHVRQESNKWFDWQEIKSYFHVFDERFEAFKQDKPHKIVIRDALAGLIVSLVAIPLGVGFSIASGMRPEQGIIAGAVAGIIGGLFGGSKFQVYGPTAAFITVIASIVANYNTEFLILASIIAGVLVLLMGVFRLGRFFNMVPHSIVVGFTIGIAITIAISQLPDLFGAESLVTPHLIEKVQKLPALFADAHGHAITLGLITFIIIRTCYKVSVFIPGPLIAIAIASFIANNIWHEHTIPIVSSKYGDIGQSMFRLTLPSLGQFSPVDLIIPVITIMFVASLESLLSARMADRLANNPTPYQPNKELFGQGLVNMIVPLLNGFPCTGALARTSTSIKVGAASPLSSLLKGSSVILLMIFFVKYLLLIPMACIAGLLIYVATNMVKPSEVREVLGQGRLHIFLMVYTALMTLLTDLFLAVMSATVIFYACRMLAGAQPMASAAIPKDAVMRD